MFAPHSNKQFLPLPSKTRLLLKTSPKNGKLCWKRQTKELKIIKCLNNLSCERKSLLGQPELEWLQMLAGTRQNIWF
jgi:hypothetical protein